MKIPLKKSRATTKRFFHGKNKTFFQNLWPALNLLPQLGRQKADLIYFLFVVGRGGAIKCCHSNQNFYNNNNKSTSIWQFKLNLPILVTPSAIVFLFFCESLFWLGATLRLFVQNKMEGENREAKRKITKNRGKETI